MYICKYVHYVINNLTYTYIHVYIYIAWLFLKACGTATQRHCGAAFDDLTSSAGRSPNTRGIMHDLCALSASPRSQKLLEIHASCGCSYAHDELVDARHIQDQVR